MMASKFLNRLLEKAHLDTAPGAPNSDSAGFAGNRLFMQIRRSALRFPRCCMEAVSGMRPFGNFYAPSSIGGIPADPLPDRSKPSDVNYAFDAAKLSKCVAMIDLWRQPRIVSGGEFREFPFHRKIRDSYNLLLRFNDSTFLRS
jgi:hypothetical protein